MPDALQAVIHLREGADQALKLVAVAHPLPTGEPVSCLDVSQSLAEKVVSQNLAVNIADTRQSPEYLESFPAPDFRSLLVVPVQSGQGVLGTLGICSNSPAAFSPDDERLLAQLGTLAAVAIQNARLHADLQAQVDALRKTRARLSQSEKLAAIGRLVAGVAHELNNPLTSMILYAQLLQTHGLDEASLNYLDKIISEAQRTSKIVGGLLEFARERPPEFQAVQIEEALDEVLDLLGYELRSRNIEIVRQATESLPLTMADPYQLQQVFVNIINNARQAMEAMPRRGRLIIRTQSGPSNYNASQPRALPVIRVSIQDNGPGIPADVLPHIFDPFFTTKPVGGGTGLGLSICYGIVSEHGGHIWVESEMGQGATFFIELPVVEPGQATGSQSEEAATLAGQGCILIIDDETLLLQALISVLEGAGFQVDGADNARAGLERLGAEKYDLVICDIRMPGMSGIDFYRQVLSLYPDMIDRLIFSTGDSISPDTQRFLEESSAPCLRKPFELRVLLKQIGEMMR